MSEIHDRLLRPSTFARDEALGEVEGLRQHRRCLGFLAMAVLMTSFWEINIAEAEKVGYNPNGKRDPFVSLVLVERPLVKARVAGLAGITSVKELKLEGIALGPKESKVAILNGETVKEGDKFGSLEIKKISKLSIVVLFENKEHVLDIYIDENSLSSGGQ